MTSYPVSPKSPVYPVSRDTPRTALDTVRDWFARFVGTVDETDLDLLALWAAHTHLVNETYTSPRLVLDSPVPGSGKTTTLEHLERVCLSPVQMASISSPAMLARLLDAGMRTILIDEADRSLSPKKEGVEDVMAILNSGYKRGGTRPVLTPTKDGWAVSEMPTYSPVAMAGNSPDLPEDTRSRCIRVLLMPDIDGQIEESDWEWIEDDALMVREQLIEWADRVRDDVRSHRPVLPGEIRGRAKERWAPLKRVAVAAGGEWPELVDLMALEDHKRVLLEREDGVTKQRPHVVLLANIAAVWGPDETFVPTDVLIDRLVGGWPYMWGDQSSYGKRLTRQRLGKMLASNYRIHSGRRDGSNGTRGYHLSALKPAMTRFRLTPSGVTGYSGETGETGYGGGSAA